jgi:hypothetical protein
MYIFGRSHIENANSWQKMTAWSELFYIIGPLVRRGRRWFLRYTLAPMFNTGLYVKKTLILVLVSMSSAMTILSNPID